jgi:hypothetical protein
MKLRSDIERTIYATTYALRLDARLALGYPQAWREADIEAGRPSGDPDRLEEWEKWCVDLAIGAGMSAIELHREAKRRHPGWAP